MNTTNTNLTFKGNPLTVSGPALSVGQQVPEFRLTGLDLSDINYSTFSGKTLVISVVPSLDTPTCSIQTKRFNTEAARISKNIAILTVSEDLPFAQKRWCGAEGVSPDALTLASDYKYRTFGEQFGAALPDLGLLARSIFVIDKNGKVVHVEYVKELSEEPSYDEALKVATEIAQ